MTVTVLEYLIGILPPNSDHVMLTIVQCVRGGEVAIFRRFSVEFSVIGASLQRPFMS